MVKHEFAFWREAKRQNIQSADALKTLLRDDDYLQTDEGQKLMKALQKSLENYQKYLSLDEANYSFSA